MRSILASSNFIMYLRVMRSVAYVPDNKTNSKERRNYHQHPLPHTDVGID